MQTPRRAAALLLALTCAVLVVVTGTAQAGTAAFPELALRTDGVVAPAGVPAPPGDLSAAGWLVADVDTGQVLAARDAHGRYAPASTLKVLTALALLPEVPPERVITPQRADVDVEGSKVGLLADSPYPAEQLYAALLMVSGNDAANALASAAGGPQTTSRLMNDEAERLGALDTRAVNPHGLDAEGQVSSPHDLAVLGRAALAEPRIADWVTTQRASMDTAPSEPPFDISNKNKLLYHYDGALGIKNGYTSRARASFIGAAERDGRRLVVSLMRADPKVWEEAGRLLDWGFAASAAGAMPVGRLPEQDPVSGAAAAVDGAVQDVTRDVAETVAEATSLRSATEPVGEQSSARVLAGALLAVAALATVRRPARRPGRPAKARARRISREPVL